MVFVRRRDGANVWMVSYGNAYVGEFYEYYTYIEHIVCSFFPGYRHEPQLNNVCVADCTAGCPLNGFCLQPEFCACDEGFALSDDSTSCIPICRQGCTNGVCVQPDMCECMLGAQYADGMCEIDTTTLADDTTTMEMTSTEPSTTEQQTTTGAIDEIDSTTSTSSTLEVESSDARIIEKLNSIVDESKHDNQNVGSLAHFGSYSIFIVYGLILVAILIVTAVVIMMTYYRKIHYNVKKSGEYSTKCSFGTNI